MSDVTATLTLSVNRSKAFDELVDFTNDLSEILEMVPEYRSEEARMIAQRIVMRMKSWAEIEARI